MENLDNGMIELLPILPTLPTTQELLNEAQSEMLSIEATLSKDDYKHTRQQREVTLGIPLTLSREEYKQLCADQVALTVRYNDLEAEVARLQIVLEEEQQEVVAEVE